MAEDVKKPDLKIVPDKDPSSIFDDLAALRKASKLSVKRKTVLVNVPVDKPPNNVPSASIRRRSSRTRR